MKNKKIIVIGGSGFLGSHVADILTENNYDVHIFDINPSKWINKKQHFIKGDILNYNHLLKAFKNAYAVFHFAGIADIKEANLNAFKSVEQNILGTTKILEACVKSKIKRFIFSSTIYVYSDFGGIYKTTKQSCELLIETFNKEKNLDFTILRFGSLYGPRANKFNFVHQAISQAIKEGKIMRKGTGNEIREYIHVSDASYACLSSLSQEYKNSYLMVTGSQRLKIKELLDMINEIMNNKLKIKYLKQRNEGHYESSPYSFKPRSAKKFIGKNEVDIGQGLLDLIYEINSEI